MKEEPNSDFQNALRQQANIMQDRRKLDNRGLAIVLEWIVITWIVNYVGPTCTQRLGWGVSPGNSCGT